MKIPKCPKTVTGKHKFVDTSYKVSYSISHYVVGLIASGLAGYGDVRGDIRCEYCGLIDDREEQK